MTKEKHKEEAQQLALPSTSDEDRRNAEECLELLFGAHLPLDKVCYAFAYGSGAIPQTGENPREKMVDFILVCNDALEFHRQNRLCNGGHYSMLMSKFTTLNWLYSFQRDGGARVFYNTMVPSRNRLIKYGVIQTEDFETDLLDWSWLYVSGRLHKPVLDVLTWPNSAALGQKPDRSIPEAIANNRQMASQAALLMLSPTFSMDEFLRQIVSLSYKGDVRMGWAEDSQKIDKLVAGAGDRLRQIYVPILERNERVQIHSDGAIEQECSTPAIYHRLQMLPYYAQRGLCNSYFPFRHIQTMFPFRKIRKYNAMMDTEELLYFIAHQHDIPEQLDLVLQNIVRKSSRQQSWKNFLSAGVTNSLRYIWPKFRKGIFRRFL